MLKAGVSAREVAQKFKLSYSRAKKICSKLKLTGDCVVGPLVLEENERRPREVIALLQNPRSQALQLRKKSQMN